MKVCSIRPGFLLLDSLVATALSVVMLSVVAVTVVSMKLSVMHGGTHINKKRHFGIETPPVRLDISCRRRGFSDDFTQNALYVCTEIRCGKSEVVFRERSRKTRIPSS